MPQHNRLGRLPAYACAETGLWCVQQDMAHPAEAAIVPVPHRGGRGAVFSR
jgi:hypothetical protein